ncbi:MAG TPA: transketolase [Planctomycetota bacterium]|nr:transketolase [Planctomycetota bacterium]
MPAPAELRLDPLAGELPPARRRALEAAWKECAETILLSTSLAASGHPGGSLSCAHLLLTMYATANVRPENAHAPDRDAILISNGHISPGVYATLAAFGFVSHDDVRLGFRRAGSAFAGHVETKVPGVEWNTGNLGQGLSAGVGAATARKLRGFDAWTYVLMGDGEQQKGQISEARRFAVKFGLNRLIAVVDRNFLQIGGDTNAVMPQEVEAEFAAAGWNVVGVDGHDFDALVRTFVAIRRGETERPDRPTCVVARTIMGKGVPFMENSAHFHGSAATDAQLREAFAHLGLPDTLDAWKARRAAAKPWAGLEEKVGPLPAIDAGAPAVRTAASDCRSAYGDVLEDLAKRNNLPGRPPKVVAVSNDLEGSCKMSGFRKASPHAFLEGGIQEQNNAVVAGRLAREGFLSFFSTFGVFGVCETYNNQRLNDINHAGVKIVCTHLGLDVGEDGPTHQNIDYVGLLRGPFGFEIYLPVDPNQTDHVVRYCARTPGNQFVGMGRSKMPMLVKPDGAPFFDAAYVFRPGRMDVYREGKDVALVTMGAATPYAVAGAKLAAERGLSVRVLLSPSVRPFDVDAVRAAAKLRGILTVEDHSVHTGLGALVAEAVADSGLSTRLARLGAVRYGSSGPSPDVFAEQGITAEGVAAALARLAG